MTHAYNENTAENKAVISFVTFNSFVYFVANCVFEVHRPRREILPDTAETWRCFRRLALLHQAHGNAFYDLHVAALGPRRDLISSDHGFAPIAVLRWRQR